MIKAKEILLAGVAVLALGVVSASAEDNNNGSDRTVGAGASVGVNAGAPLDISADTNIKTDASVKPQAGTEVTADTHAKAKKKTHHKKHVKKSEVLNSTPGDKKTSNDNSGMSGDVEAHGKVKDSTSTDTGNQ